MKLNDVQKKTFLHRIDRSIQELRELGYGNGSTSVGDLVRFRNDISVNELDHQELLNIIDRIADTHDLYLSRIAAVRASEQEIREWLESDGA